MLTAELLSEFVKETTKTEDKRFKKDQNVYGTTVEYDGQIYVKIDGSDILTPVNTTVSMKGGERVILTIKNHSADVTGNLSSPSCGTVDIDDRVLQVKSEIEQDMDHFKTTITGSFVSTDDLNQVKTDLENQTNQTISEVNKAMQDNYDNLESRIITSQSQWEQTFDGFKSTVAGTYLTKEEFADSDIGNLSSSVTQVQQDLTSFKTTVAGTYATKDSVNQISTSVSTMNQDLNGFKTTVINTYAKIDDLNEAKTELESQTNQAIAEVNTAMQDNYDNLESRITTSQTQWEQTFNGFKSTVAATYLTKQEFEDSDIGNLSSSVTQVQQDLTSFKTTVAGKYLTKQEFEDSDIGSLSSSVTTMKQDLTSFKTTVSGTYATKDSVNQLSSTVSTMTQDLNGFKTTVANTYAKTTDLNNAKNKISSVEQTANKISLIVKSGNSVSNMVLTDGFYSVVSKNIKLSADRITMEGLVTANSNFKILTDGSCEASDIIVNNTMSASTVIANDINIPWVDKSFTRDVTVKIKPSHTHSDNYNLLNEDTYKSFTDLMNICPKDLNGYTLTINMLEDLTENATLEDFSNGTIIINMNGHAIKGHVYSPNRSLSIDMFGNTSTELGSGTYGKIIPGSVGKYYGGFRYGIVACKGYLGLYEIDFYAGTSTDCATKGVTMAEGGYIFMYACRAINKPDSLLRVQVGARGYVDSSSGTTVKSSFQAVSGGLLQLNNTTQCGINGGGTSTFVTNNGLIYSTGVTFQSSAITDGSSSSTNPSTTTTTTKTKTITSDYGRCYRTTVYNNWGTDNIVRQGQYGYGMNKGLWFFGNNLYNIIQNAKSIDSIAIKITRQAGGVYAAHTHYVLAHTYGTKPSGEPSFISSNTFQATFSIPTNSSTTIYLTANQIAALKSSKAKGLGLYTSSTDRGMYSTCSGSCVVTITYKE